jgi:hypothetical protein
LGFQYPADTVLFQIAALITYNTKNYPSIVKQRRGVTPFFLWIVFEVWGWVFKKKQIAEFLEESREEHMRNQS